ncbi:hypothetical protein MRS44_017055 [Fusarium solani]|uniref:uncharacterized protein n=1 Tax=Fusarium solani TaxID=169388 RepID=UPI0032C45FB5|nr:hypothetical protein MRS44_017055 [Fusarium solani]
MNPLPQAADEDADSALEVPLSESLASLRSSIFAYQEENGRTYHAMSAGNLQHHVMTLTIGGRHCLCPKNDGAARVLDLGTGTGIWAIDQLQPGGYFEAQDIGHLRCDDGTLSETSDLLRWMTLIQEGLEKLGRSTTAAEERKSTMEAVGFEGVVETVYKWPTNHWPRDKKYKDLGGGTGAPDARAGLVEGGGAGAGGQGEESTEGYDCACLLASFIGSDGRVAVDISISGGMS